MPGRGDPFLQLFQEVPKAQSIGVVEDAQLVPNLLGAVVERRHAVPDNIVDVERQKDINAIVSMMVICNDVVVCYYRS